MGRSASDVRAELRGARSELERMRSAAVAGNSLLGAVRSASEVKDRIAALEVELAMTGGGGVARVGQTTPGEMAAGRSPEVADRHAELMGRIGKDSAYSQIRVALEAAGGMPDEVQEAQLVALSSESMAERGKVPMIDNARQGVAVHLGPARRLRRVVDLGGDVKDYLSVALAYTTTDGNSAGNIGATIPTLVASEFVEIQESINGVRRIPGVNVMMTGTAAEQEWPVYREYDATTGAISAAIGTENTTTTQRWEGYAGTISTQPREFVGFAEVSKNALAMSAVDLMPAITTGLARTISRITERAYAVGTGSGQPAGVFTNPGADYTTQAAATGGRATADEILALPGLIPDLDGGMSPVWGVSRSNWFGWIRRLQTQAPYAYDTTGNAARTGDTGFYALASNMYGMPQPGAPYGGVHMLDGAPAYEFSYAPSGTGATDHYLVLFSPSAFWIHDYERVEITRDDSVGFLARRSTFLVSLWTDSVWQPTSLGSEARATISGRA